MGSNTQTHCWTHGTAIVYNPFLLNSADGEAKHREIEPFNFEDDLPDQEEPDSGPDPNDPQPDPYTLKVIEKLKEEKKQQKKEKDRRFRIAYTPDGCLLYPPKSDGLNRQCRLYLPLTTIGQISDFAFYFLGLRLVYDTEHTGIVISDLKLIFSNTREVDDLNISIPNSGLSGDFLTTTTMGKNAWDCNPPREVRQDPGNNGLTLEITFRVEAIVQDPIVPVRIAGAGYIYRHRGFDEN
ncbi:MULTISPECIES: hypothetical protein [Bacillus cereus group]|uniref:Uncharacterized protein n=2 Tax=Bacillus cereus group TaxID=86661 RepID=A0A2B9DK13_BACCE|nr:MULTISPECIES: hypothetical protein [Bacillus cereus group]PEM55471.1 hypothetical protein CN611_14470 [Bacillus wiedmannii]PGA92476.1 hypothetical protein COL92_30020 [Bacillus wiedmannii]PGM87983.1 hypothetical protein CN958_27765 [Bacillus cereus]